MPREVVAQVVAAEPGARSRALLPLLYFGGLRVSEATGLRWRDVQAREVTPYAFPRNSSAQSAHARAYVHHHQSCRPPIDAARRVAADALPTQPRPQRSATVSPSESRSQES